MKINAGTKLELNPISVVPATADDYTNSSIHSFSIIISLISVKIALLFLEKNVQFNKMYYLSLWCFDKCIHLYECTMTKHTAHNHNRCHVHEGKEQAERYYGTTLSCFSSSQLLYSCFISPKSWKLWFLNNYKFDLHQNCKILFWQEARLCIKGIKFMSINL